MTAKRECGACDVCMRLIPTSERVECAWSAGFLPQHLMPTKVRACMHGLKDSGGKAWLIVHQEAGTRTTNAMRSVVAQMSIRTPVVVIVGSKCFQWSGGEIVRRFDKANLQQEVNGVPVQSDL